jgi:hypothetical protein
LALGARGPAPRGFNGRGARDHRLGYKLDSIAVLHASLAASADDAAAAAAAATYIHGRKVVDYKSGARRRRRRRRRA